MKAYELIAVLEKLHPDTPIMVAYDSMACISDASSGGVWIGDNDGERVVFICADTADIDGRGDDYPAKRLDAAAS